MLSTSNDKTIIGLDVEAGSLAASQLDGNGSRSVSQVAITPLEGGLIKEGEVIDPEGLSAALRSMFAEHKLSKTVRVGIANQRVAVRTFRLPLIEDPKELDTAIRFQAQEHLPMPLDQAVLDHQVVARSDDGDGARSMEVVAVAARRDMLQSLLAALSGAGLRPAGIDLSAFALIRALSGATDGPTADPTDSTIASEPGPEGTHAPASLYCNLGDVTNLAVARGSSCLFTRVSPFGVEVIAQRLAERRTLAMDHARQWLTHVGFERPLGEIEGDPEIIAATREVLEEGASKLADELRLSLEFYAAQEGVPPVERIVIAGAGSAIPGLIGRLQTGLGQDLATVRPGALAQLGDEAAARLTVSYGLALED
jgi:Tfp pilus assembly protein, ATPase PilM